MIDDCSAHPFQKKEWYNIHVPTVFDVRTPTITPCNKTAGQSKLLPILMGFLTLCLNRDRC